MQAPLTDEADGSARPLAGPSVPQPADPPTLASPVEELPVPPAIEPPAAAPPVEQLQESQPAVEPPADAEPAPASSPKDTDSGRFDGWRAVPRRTLFGAPAHPIRGQTRQSAEASRRPVLPAKQASHNDPIQPRDEPRPRQEPVRPTVEPSSQSVADVSSRRREAPTGLNGFCAVQLMENESWVNGDSRWAAEHRGRVYLMSGADQHQLFLANPDRYAPVLTGNDPVLAVDEGRQEQGRTNHCIVYDGHLYSFSSASTLTRFRQNPKRYTAIGKQAAN